MLYLKSASPELMLYVSPVAFDPSKPVYPVFYPANLGSELEKHIGTFCTLGSPYETKSLNDGVLNNAEFLEYANIIFRERKRMLFNRLERFDSGMFFFYFEITDIIQHMFFKYVDESHPMYDKESARLYGKVILRWYQKFDDILGDVLDLYGNDAVVLVLSDHGFNSFKYGFNLNSWLKKKKLLYLNPGKSTGSELFADVNWTRTRAYAVGFSGLYVNLNGRESDGIVLPGNEYEELLDYLARELEDVKNPETGEKVVNKVYRASEIYTGKYSENAPDLIIGYNRGYRSGWQSAIGAVPSEILELNEKEWSGDHIIDPALIPGIFFANKNIDTRDISLDKIAGIIKTEFTESE